jgi:hypothetical protein
LIQHKKIFNSSYDYSLTNQNSFYYWFGALYNNSQEQNLLKNNLGISSFQLNLVLTWWKSLTIFLEEDILQYLGIENISEIGILQWSTGSVTPCLKTFYHELNLKNFSFQVEYECFCSCPSYRQISLNQSKLLFNGPHNLTNTQNMIDFLKFLEQENTTLWNLTIGQAENLFKYLNETLTPIISDNLQYIFQKGGGIFTNHTVNEWLWNGIDPLLELIRPSNPYMNLFSNYSTVEIAEENAHIYSFYTGKNNINLVDQYIMWDNLTEVTIWKEPIPVQGTDGTEFQPFLNKGENLLTWVSQLVRPIQLNYTGTTTEYFNIEMYRYMIAPSALDINDTFYQSIYGMANLTSYYNGVPIYISKPNMLGVDPYYVNLTLGMNATEEKDDTFLYVEPITGITMNAHKRLQLNIYLDSLFKNYLNIFTPNISTGLFYPIVSVEESAEITENDANLFKSEILKPIYLTKVVFFAFCIVLGIVLIGIGIGLIITFYIKKRKNQEKYAFQDQPIELSKSKIGRSNKTKTE